MSSCFIVMTLAEMGFRDRSGWSHISFCPPVAPVELRPSSLPPGSSESQTYLSYIHPPMQSFKGWDDCLTPRHLDTTPPTSSSRRPSAVCQRRREQERASSRNWREEEGVEEYAAVDVHARERCVVLLSLTRPSLLNHEPSPVAQAFGFFLPTL